MTPTTLVRFEPRGAAAEALRSRADALLLSGAAGTGKSVPMLLRLHLACLTVPGVRCLLVRKTLVSLTASTLVSFREKVAAEAISAGVVKWYGGSSAEPAAYRYANGSVIVVGSLDQPTRLLSTEYDLVFLDEATEATPDDVDTILSRLRNGRFSAQQLLMATNPSSPTHHLKRRADAGGISIFYSKHEDNPKLWVDGEWTPEGRSYLGRLDKLTGHRFERLRWGRWTSAEGVIYTDYEAAIHLIDPFDVPAEWTRWWVVDFGYSNPFCWQHWAQDPDGRLYLVQEIYRTGRLVEDHARDIRNLVAPDGAWIAPRPRMVICDHDAEDRATLQRHLSIGTVAARKDVTAGIQLMQARLRPAGDGKPRMFFFRDATAERDQALAEAGKPTSTAEELDGYVWEPSPDGKPSKERPLKVNDHGADCARYLCAHVDQPAPINLFMDDLIRENEERRGLPRPPRRPDDDIHPSLRPGAGSGALDLSDWTGGGQTQGWRRPLGWENDPNWQGR